MNALPFRPAIYKTQPEAATAAGELFACECEHKQVTRRTLRNGSLAIVRQCVRCGCADSSPISRASVSNWASLPAFDDALYEGWHDAKSSAFAAIHLHFRQKWMGDYSQYLRSNTWRAKRELVMRRASGVCEGCMGARATQVHHLTYKHVGDELLFELAAVCDACHERAHQEPEP